MKGILINNNIEYLLETKKESWTQGESIDGIFKVKNHNKKEVTLEKIRICLAEGEFKKVHTKSADSFSLIYEHFLNEQPFVLLANEVREYPFTLPLAPHCYVTDKSGSLYLLYGESDLLIKMAPLQLNITIHKHLQEVVKVFETFLRFKLSGMKSKNGDVEFKLIPPKNRQFALVDFLSLKMRLEGDSLLMKYIFNFRSITSEHSQIKVAVKKKEYSQTLIKKDYSLYGDFPNDQGIKEKIEEILNSAFH